MPRAQPGNWCDTQTKEWHLGYEVNNKSRKHSAQQRLPGLFKKAAELALRCGHRVLLIAESGSDDESDNETTRIFHTEMDLNDAWVFAASRMNSRKNIVEFNHESYERFLNNPDISEQDAATLPRRQNSAERYQCQKVPTESARGTVHVQEVCQRPMDKRLFERMKELQRMIDSGAPMEERNKMLNSIMTKKNTLEHSRYVRNVKYGRNTEEELRIPPFIPFHLDFHLEENGSLLFKWYHVIRDEKVFVDSCCLEPARAIDPEQYNFKEFMRKRRRYGNMTSSKRRKQEIALGYSSCEEEESQDTPMDPRLGQQGPDVMEADNSGSGMDAFLPLPSPPHFNLEDVNFQDFLAGMDEFMASSSLDPQAHQTYESADGVIMDAVPMVPRHPTPVPSHKLTEPLEFNLSRSASKKKLFSDSEDENSLAQSHLESLLSIMSIFGRKLVEIREERIEAQRKDIIPRANKCVDLKLFTLFTENLFENINQIETS